MLKKDLDGMPIIRGESFYLNDIILFTDEIKNKSVLPEKASELKEFFNSRLNQLENIKFEISEKFQLRFCLHLCNMVFILHCDDFIEKVIAGRSRLETDSAVLKRNYFQLCLMQKSYLWAKDAFSLLEIDEKKHFQSNIDNLIQVVVDTKKKIYTHASNFYPLYLLFYFNKKDFTRDCVQILEEKLRQELQFLDKERLILPGVDYKLIKKPLEISYALCHIKKIRFYRDATVNINNSTIEQELFCHFNNFIRTIGFLQSMRLDPYIRNSSKLISVLENVFFELNQLLHNLNEISRNDSRKFQYWVSLKLEIPRLIISLLFSLFYHPSILNTILSYFLPRELNRPNSLTYSYTEKELDLNLLVSDSKRRIKKRKTSPVILTDGNDQTRNRLF